MKYCHLFFDLDHTLWDFETNSREALLELYQQYHLVELLGVDPGTFLQTYYRINEAMWALYRAGKVSKEQLRHQRFLESFQAFGFSDLKKIRAFEQEYIALAPQKTALMPGCLEMLAELGPHCRMHIITNGFEETQYVKLERSGLRAFFDQIITSDQLQVQKPAATIFVEAMRLAGAKRSESLMIGDNLAVDILGARKVGMAQAFYNPVGQIHREKITFELQHLNQLPALVLGAL